IGSVSHPGFVLLWEVPLSPSRGEKPLFNGPPPLYSPAGRAQLPVPGKRSEYEPAIDQPFAQPLQAFADALGDGAAWHADGAGRLGMRAAIEIAQDEGQPVLLRQTPQFFVECLADFLLFELGGAVAGNLK